MVHRQLADMSSRQHVNWPRTAKASPRCPCRVRRTYSVLLPFLIEDGSQPVACRSWL